MTNEIKLNKSMKSKIKIQKGFIQNPLLIIIIASVAVVSVGTGVVLHTQGKLDPLIANVSEVFKEAEKPDFVDYEKEIGAQELQINEKQKVVQESNKETGQEIKKLKEIIRNQQTQIDKLLNRPPKIKEVIKEAPVEKIVYKDNPQQTETIEGLNNLINFLRKQIASLENQITSLQSQVQSLTSENQNLREQIRVLRPVPNQPTPTQAETYTYHDYFPIILSLSDNKGNIRKHSDHNGYRGPHTSFRTNTVLRIGDEIYLKVEARDPQNRQILYNWSSNSNHFNQLIGLEDGRFRWTTSNKIKYTISSETIKTAGDLLRIVVRIKSEKEYLRRPTGPYDDVTYLDYNLSL